MMINRFTSWLFGSLAVMVLAHPAHAQNYQPFIDPGYFNSDLQFFAPASDIDDYGGPVQRTGWFGAYDRMYLRTSRPDDAESVTSMDRGWGNRWDLGYMTDGVNHDHGWLFSYMRLDGPNSYNSIWEERINRVNEDDEGRTPPDEDDPDLVNPPQDRNNIGPPNQARVYQINDSLNVAKLNSFEVNKLFRMPPLNHGGLLEPFLGFRYIQFQNTWQDQDYVRYDEFGFVFPFPPSIPNTDLFDVSDAVTEDLIDDRFLFTNDMIGGQLGIRWAKRVSRWNLSSEVRMFAFHNIQKLERDYSITRTYYDGGGTGSEVNGVVQTRATESWNTTTSLIGMDIRAEAGFELTRDVTFNAGMQYLGFFDGIGRGFDINYNSQDLNMIGLTFGVVVNR